MLLMLGAGYGAGVAAALALGSGCRARSPKHGDWDLAMGLASPLYRCWCPAVVLGPHGIGAGVWLWGWVCRAWLLEAGCGAEVSLAPVLQFGHGAEISMALVLGATYGAGVSKVWDWGPSTTVWRWSPYGMAAPVQL